MTTNDTAVRSADPVELLERALVERSAGALANASRFARDALKALQHSHASRSAPVVRALLIVGMIDASCRTI